MFSDDDDDCDFRTPGNEEAAGPSKNLDKHKKEPKDTPKTSSNSELKKSNMKICEMNSGPDESAVNELKTMLMLPVANGPKSSSRKITIVGAGNVGMACTIGLLTKGIVSEICLMDNNLEKVIGEALDVNHGSQFIHSAKIIPGDANFKACAGSKVIIVTAGVRQQDGEDRISLLQRNADVLRTIIPQLAASSPDAIFLVVSNPVDILTYMTWKLSGLPQNRVFGSGTNLDTARFRYLLAKRLGVAAESCDAYIIGEHGDLSVPVWSSASIGGTLLRNLMPTIGTDEDPANWKCIHQEVVQGAYEVIKLKGFTNWAIGFSVVDLVSSIVNNKNRVHCISVPAKGMYGIENEAYLSLPCVIGESGYTRIVKQTLSTEEQEKLRHSAQMLADNIRQTKI